MKRIGLAFLPALFVVGPLVHVSAEQLIPAGSLIQCTVAEPKLSSKTADIGDPVLCQVSRVELYGRSVLPYGSYLVGRFEEYKDPGHFVGKGWMELRFERMVIPPDRILPVAAKVVYAPKYDVDKLGKIHGNGHPVKDTIEWMIPVLWPIDLINLPRRGPRPQLKAETRLTLKIMDDLGVPTPAQSVSGNYGYPQAAPPQDPYGFSQRPPATYYAPQAAPYAPQAAPAPRPYTPMVAPRPAFVAPRIATVLMLRDGYGQFAVDYWYDPRGQIGFLAMDGASVEIPANELDFARTVEVNRLRGVSFNLRGASY
ncbi:MAG: hypothetical protein ACJ74Y_00220 [Bryobacteraceae bacterium]